MTPSRLTNIFNLTGLPLDIAGLGIAIINLTLSLDIVLDVEADK